MRRRIAIGRNAQRRAVRMLPSRRPATWRRRRWSARSTASCRCWSPPTRPRRSPRALRLQREFGFDLVLDGAAEAYLLLDEIRAAGAPVVVHPPMSRVRNGSFETAARLAEAGVPFAIQTGFEGYVPKTRVLLWEAAIAAANGLGRERALEAVTLGAARILGVDGRVGSVEVGKDADLALFDGDPFEYTTHVCGVVIESEVLSRECR